MYRQVPNIITLGRLLLTGLFFCVLEWPVPAGEFAAWMWLALAMFILATVSDALDGYLARSWKVESAFGRVVDPFADKILICGSLVFFSAPNFLPPHLAIPPTVSPSGVTGIWPWMAVVLIAREFLVTGIRGLAEGRGIDFRASWSGKIKMVVQSLAVSVILFYLALLGAGVSPGVLHGWAVTRDILIWLTIVVTLFSAGQYIVHAWRVIQA